MNSNNENSTTNKIINNVDRMGEDKSSEESEEFLPLEESSDTDSCDSEGSSVDDGVCSESGTVSVSFVYPDASEKVCEAEVGDTLLNVIRNNDIPIPCSCGGALACSTCHVILEEEVFDSLEDQGKEASDDEEDLLDVASGRKDTSRLGCQVTVDQSMDGMKIEIPK